MIAENGPPHPTGQVGETTLRISWSCGFHVFKYAKIALESLDAAAGEERFTIDCFRGATAIPMKRYDMDVADAKKEMQELVAKFAEEAGAEFYFCSS